MGNGPNGSMTYDRISLLFLRFHYTYNQSETKDKLPKLLFGKLKQNKKPQSDRTKQRNRTPLFLNELFMKSGMTEK